MAEQIPNKQVQGFGGRRGNFGAPTEKPKDGRKTLKRLASYFASERKAVILLSLTVTAGVIASVLAPSYQSNAVDQIVGRTFDALPRFLILMLVMHLIHGAAVLLQGYLSASLSQRIVCRLRGELFDRTVRLPISFLDNHSHGDLISRMTNDAENISGIISNSLSSLFSGILTLIGTLFMMLRCSVKLGLLSCSSVILTVLLTSLMSRAMRRLFVKRQTLLGELNGTVEEMVTNYRTIAAYNRQDQVTADFNGTADQLAHTSIIAEIISNCMGPMMNMLSNLSFVIVSVFGAYFVLKGEISVGVISAFIIYSKQFSRPINELAQLYGQIQTAAAGAERVFEMLDAEPEDFSGEDVGPVHGVIEFRHVDFSYVPEKKVISDFSLTIDSGKKIALVGSTGSGKTTIINLLMRFYEIDSGEILLDGKDIRTLALRQLRDSVGIVLQDTKLFSDTIRNNISYAAGTVTDEELAEAAHLSCTDRIAAKLPNGYDTMLSQTGVSLSQGEQQLIAIGRAFLSRPQILILDEATSSVDTRTELSIQKAMNRLMEGRTSLIIAHRLSTIQDADQIIVMDQGHIAEIGTHKELLAHGGSYHKLYMTQFAGQET